MNSPSTYSEWVDVLEAFLDGEREVAALKAMSNGSFQWTSGAAQHLSRRVVDTINQRLQTIQQQLSKELEFAAGQESAIVKALLHARQRLANINELLQIDVFQEQISSSLSENLHETVKQLQSSLEDYAKQEMTGRLRMIVKHNALTHYDQIQQRYEPIAAEINLNSSVQNKVNRKRRIIL